MKIAIHSHQFSHRGDGKVPYDYGVYLQEYLNHEVVYIGLKRTPGNEGVNKLSKRFKVHLYEKPLDNNSVYDIIQKEKIDFIHVIKSGENDGFMSNNPYCKTGIHCVFNLDTPHGDVYAAVSDYLARCFRRTLYVPHIITTKNPTEDFRVKYNIPNDAFVVGRHGGPSELNVEFIDKTVTDVLEKRKDIYFLFLSTRQFINHERVIHIPPVEEEQDVYNFIHACDCMLHGRGMGETFGLSVGEFSSCNKPIITWSGKNSIYPYHKCHLEILGDKAIKYDDGKDLFNILTNLNKSDFVNKNWDAYTEKFSPKNVMEQYKKVFLN